jgi:ribosome-associated protein
MVARRISLLAENTPNSHDLSNEQAPWAAAVRAAGSKKAHDVRVLDLREVASFADHFLVCHGTNPRQIQAISDAIGGDLAKIGERPVSVEGYQNAEWILMDYGDFLVHIFSEKAREYYALERLWRHAKDVPIPASIEP